MTRTVKGHGGDGGGGAIAQHVPYETPDSLRSNATVKILDVLSEGPIQGLVAGLKSIKINGTPIQATNGAYNFKNLDVAMRLGLPNQAYIPGFAVTEEDVTDGRELKYSDGTAGKVKTFADSTMDRVRLTMGFPTLSKSDPANGDLGGTSVSFKVSVSSAATGDIYKEDFTDTVSGKTTTRYQKSYVIDLRGKYGPSPWNVKIERLTLDSDTVSLSNKTFIDQFTKIVDAKLRYPNTALAAVIADAQSFTSVPSRSYVVQGLLVKVPSNYTPRDPVKGTVASYNGSWDGTFKMAWTENPAWCFYDMMTEERYGLGDYIPESLVDKWALYQIAQYCDQLVPNGLGGTEPRFTCNLYLQTQEDAYKVLANFASIFRGMTYWASGAVWATQDRPADAVYLFTEANVKDGKFSYAGSARRARHNVISVAWNDPDDGYTQKLEYVQDDESIQAFGRIMQTDIVAMGCTSRGQANRLGRWLLYTERYEEEVVSFTTGLEGIMARPGDIIKVQDQSRVSKRFGGRVISATSSSITLDAPVTIESGKSYTLWCTLPDGTPSERAVLTSPSTTDTLSVTAFPDTPGTMTEWVLSASDLVPQTFRVVGVTESEKGEYQVSALKHIPGKYDYVENGIELSVPLDGSLGAGGGGNNTTGLGQITNLTLGEYLYISGIDVKTMLTASWDALPLSRNYAVSWKRGEGNWNTIANTTSPNCEIPDVLPGPYFVRVSALMMNGQSTVTTTAGYIVLGKTAPPSDVTNFHSTLAQATIELAWDAVFDLDLDSYEIKSGIDWATGTTIYKDSAANKFTWQRPADGNYTLWIKAKDTSGNYSTNAATATLTVNPTDDFIVPQEKRDIKDEWDSFVAEQVAPVFGLDAQATAVGVTTEKVAYDAAILAYGTYLEGLFDPGPVDAWASNNWVNYSKSVNLLADGNTGGGARFRLLAKAVTDSRNTLLGAIQSAIQANLNSIFSDDTLSKSEKRQLELLYNTILAEQPGMDAMATQWGITTEKAAYDTAITVLTAGLVALSPAWNDYTVDTPLGVGGGAALNTKFKNVYSAKNALQNKIDALAKSTLDDIFSDNKLTPLEKPDLVDKVTQIVAEQNTPVTGLDAQATAFSISHTAYDNAIAALVAYLALPALSGWNVIPGVTIDLTLGGAISGATLRGKLNSVYSERDALYGKITNAAKASVDAILSDDVLSMAEKPLFSLSYNDLVAERVGLDAQASSWGITTEKTNYDNDMTTLTAAVTGLSPAYSVMTADTLLGAGGGAVLRAKFSAVYSSRTALITAIDGKANGAISDIYSDDKITPGEKPFLVDAYANIISEQTTAITGMDAVADGFHVSRVAYDASITALAAHLATAPLSGWNTIPGVTVDLGAGGGAVLRGKFSAVYAAREALKGAINNVAAASIAGITSDDILSRGEKRNFSLIYNNLLAEQASIDSQATSWGITTEKTSYDTTITNLTVAVTALTPAYNDVTADTPLGVGGGIALNAKFLDVFNRKASLLAVIDSKSKSAIDDIFSDDVLTPNEKIVLVDKYNLILSEKNTATTGLDARALALGQSSAAYDGKVNALTALLTGYVGWNNLTTTTNLGAGKGAPLRQAFQDVYAERDALEGLLQNGLKTSIGDILSDDIIASSEKAYMVDAYANIISEQTTAVTGLDAIADLVQVSRTIYDTAISTLTTALNAITGWNVIPGVSVNLGVGGGAALRTKWNNVIQARDKLRAACITADGNDDVLGVPRKLQFIQTWDAVLATQTQLIAQCTTYGLAHATYDAAIAAVTTFFSTRQTPVAWNVVTGATALGVGGGAALRVLMKTIQTEEDKLRNSLSSAAAIAAVGSGATDAMLKSGFVDPISGKINWTMISAAIQTIFSHQLYVANFDNLIPNPMSEDPAPASGWPAAAFEGMGLDTGNSAVYIANGSLSLGSGDSGTLVIKAPGLITARNTGATLSIVGATGTITGTVKLTSSYTNGTTSLAVTSTSGSSISISTNDTIRISQDTYAGGNCRFVAAGTTLKITTKIACGPQDQYAFRCAAKNANAGSGAAIKIYFNGTQATSGLVGQAVVGSVIVNQAYSPGSTAINVNTGGSGSTNIKKGDEILFAGDPNVYRANADLVLDSNKVGTLYLLTGLVLSKSTGAAITTAYNQVETSATSGAPAGTTYVEFVLYGGTGGGYFDNFYARRMNDAMVLVDGAVTAQKLEAILAMLGEIRSSSPAWQAGTALASPTGFRLSGAPFTTYFKDGTSASDCLFELGGSANFAGYKAATLADRIMGSYNRIRNGGFAAGMEGWDAPIWYNKAILSYNSDTGQTTYYTVANPNVDFNDTGRTTKAARLLRYFQDAEGNPGTDTMHLRQSLALPAYVPSAATLTFYTAPTQGGIGACTYNIKVIFTNIQTGQKTTIYNVSGSEAFTTFPESNTVWTLRPIAMTAVPGLVGMTYPTEWVVDIEVTVTSQYISDSMRVCDVTLVV